MMTLRLPLCLAAAVILTADRAAGQGFDLDFTLVNLTTAAVTEYYVIAHDEGDWSHNLLRDDPLWPDQSVTFIFPDALHLCLYDIHLRFSDNSYLEDTVDICEREDYVVRD